VSDSAPDDRRLMTDHLAGDPDAFSVLVRRHRDRLWAVALRTLGDREEAADALQDALISAYRNAAGYRGDAAVTTWLHRVVVNACIDRLRRRQSRPSVPLEDRELASARDEHAATEARLDVHAALARLPEAQRVPLVLVDLEDLSVAEVAELLGTPEGTVKSRCARARLSLAAILRDRTDWNPDASSGVRAGRQDAGRPAPASGGIRLGTRAGSRGDLRDARGRDAGIVDTERW
jgi:RNA polymerase sigma-70 factor, ECF subfamily